MAFCISISLVFASSKETSIFFLFISQLAAVTPSTDNAAVSIVFLHIAQLPRTPKLDSFIAISLMSFGTSTSMFFSLSLFSVLQLAKPTKVIMAILKITFFIILKFKIIVLLFVLFLHNLTLYYQSKDYVFFLLNSTNKLLRYY